MATTTEPAAHKVSWFLYLIRCHDNCLYTGISTDVGRRLSQHRGGKGAKYLRGKGPLKLVFQLQMESHSMALKAELLVKKCSRQEKEEIILHGLPEKILMQLKL